MSRDVRSMNASPAMVGVVLFFGAWIASILLFLFFGMDPNTAFSLSNFTAVVPVVLYYIILKVRNKSRSASPVHANAYSGERSAGALKCAGCGATINQESPYELTRKPLIGKPKVYCPSCAARREAALLRKNPEKAKRLKDVSAKRKRL